MNYPLDKVLFVSKEAAISAGKVIMQIYEDSDAFEAEYKKDNTPITIADKKANRIIVDILKEQFPEYAILSEEEVDDKKRLNNPYCFIIDPLDGTKEFINRNGEFTVNIALAENHRVILGVIYMPVTEELYYASVENGTYYQNKREKKQLYVSNNVDNLTLVTSHSHKRDVCMNAFIKQHPIITNVIYRGSSIKGCMIASGEADVYYRFVHCMEWDTAAMHCIVEQAGGYFRQLDGTEMLYNRIDSNNNIGFYALNSISNLLLN